MPVVGGEGHAALLGTPDYPFGQSPNPIPDWASVLLDPRTPSSWKGCTVPKWAIGNSNGAAPPSGTMLLAACPMYQGAPVSSISFVSQTTAGVALTAQWFSIFDANLNRLAVTADDGATAWASDTQKTLAIAQVAQIPAGPFVAGSVYVIPSTGLYYLGFLVTAGTLPTLRVNDLRINSAQNPIPAYTGTGGSTGLTVPSSCPTVFTGSNRSAMPAAWCE